MGKIDFVLKEVEYLYQHYVEIGILAEDSEKKPSGKKTTILEYAIYNEFGTSKMPARPFFRTALYTNDVFLRSLIEELFRKVLTGRTTGEKALKEIGETVRSFIIESINKANNWAVPLAPATLKVKLSKRPGNNKILIDDRYLIRSIRYKIVHVKGAIKFISGFKEV